MYAANNSRQVTPDPSSPAGYAVRSTILDLVDIFEVNRKECARLLLEVPKWLPPGTFRPRPGAPPQDVVAGKDWQLESTIIEVRAQKDRVSVMAHQLIEYLGVTLLDTGTTT